MKRSIRNLALVVMGALISGCAEQIEDLQPSAGGTVIMKTTVSLSENASTRALAADGTKTFAAGDKIAVIYQNTAGETVKAESAELTAADITNSGKNAAFTVSLTNPKASTSVRYIYPASRAAATVATDVAVNDDATIDYAALATQDGTFASIASKLDLATFDGSLTAQGNLPSTVSLTNPLTIGEFTIKNNDGGSDLTSSVTKLIIGDGLNVYTVSRAAAAGPIYVAMKPVTSSQIVVVDATAGTDYYSIVKGKTLEASNIYDITVNATKSLSDLSKALVANAIVTINYTIDGVGYTSTFKREGDEYKLQSTTPAARAMTRAESRGSYPDPYAYSIPDPQSTTGAQLLRIQVNQNNQTRIDVTINVATCEQVTNYTYDGKSNFQSVSVDGIKASTKVVKKDFVNIWLKTPGGVLFLGDVYYEVGAIWDEVIKHAHHNGCTYLEGDYKKSQVYFTVNGYSGYLVDKNGTPVQLKDKVGTLGREYYLKGFNEITFQEYSWDATDRKLVSKDITRDQFNLVTSSSSTIYWNAGTYLVKEDVTINGDIGLKGNVNLILCDGCTLTVNGFIFGNKNAFTIYGQAGGTGKLSLTTNRYGLYFFSDLVIHGGNVESSTKNNHIFNLKMYGGKFTAKSSGSDPTIDTYTDNNMTIYGGELEAISDNSNAISVGDDNNPGTLTVYGGKVTAKAPNGQAIKGYFAKGEGCNIGFFATDDLSNWGEALLPEVTTSTKHYFKAEVDEGPAVVSGND